MSDTNLLIKKQEKEGESDALKFLLSSYHKKSSNWQKENLSNFYLQENNMNGSLWLPFGSCFKETGYHNQFDHYESVKLVDHDRDETSNKDDLKKEDDWSIFLNHEKEACFLTDLNWWIDESHGQPEIDTKNAITNLVFKENLWWTLKNESSNPKDSSCNAFSDDTQNLDSSEEIYKPEQKRMKKSLKKIGLAKAGWSYFSLRRACFRGMSAYYKEQYEEFIKSTKMPLHLRNDLNQAATSFIKHEFNLDKMGNWDITGSEFLSCVITILHSHKHKKNEEAIRSRDFTKIRNILYSFSIPAKEAFLSTSEYAWLFTHFHNSAGKSFLEEISLNKPKNFKKDLEIEFRILDQEAKDTIGLI